MTRITTMVELHHFNVDDLKLQLQLRQVFEPHLRLPEGKKITVGGNRETLLGRLKSVLLLENPNAADGYDLSKPKTFYVGHTTHNAASCI